MAGSPYVDTVPSIERAIETMARAEDCMRRCGERRWRSGELERRMSELYARSMERITTGRALLARRPAASPDVAASSAADPAEIEERAAIVLLRLHEA